MNFPRLVAERLHKAGWDERLKKRCGSREDRREEKGHRKQDERTMPELVSQRLDSPMH